MQRKRLWVPALRRLCGGALGAVLAATAGAAGAQPVDRGRLLYETHCIECHTTQMHWRAQRAASDWTALRAQVTRWQASLQLQWTASEIDAVAGYLNDTIYRHPRSQAVGAASMTERTKP